MQGKGKKTGNIIRKTGTILVGVGIVLMLAGLCLFVRNRREDDLAGKRAQEALAEVKKAIEMGAAFSGEMGDDTAGAGGNNTILGRGNDMTPDGGNGIGGHAEDIQTVLVGDYEYAGYLRIPSLGLELPVMAQWSYPRLKIAPCIYHGSAAEGDLVIAAHNYARHFGGLSKLEQGAEVTYTDVEGCVWYYEVETTDVLAPEAVEEMTDAGYALTLFTCTYGGASRVTVRCVEAEE